MGRLDRYHIIVVTTYFNTLEDFVEITLVCKKYKQITEEFHFNPFPLTRKTIFYFPNIETLHLWKLNHEHFGNDITIKKTSKKICKMDSKRNKMFFKIIVWYPVTFKVSKTLENTNFVFKNVLYTLKDRKSNGFTIPNEVNCLSDYCFCGCNLLANIIIPQKVTSLGNSCFHDCRLLSKIILPINIKSLGQYCFSHCYSLTSIDIPKDVTYVGPHCFEFCANLEMCRFLGTVSDIGDNCFVFCEKLREVEISVEIKNDFFKNNFGKHTTFKVRIHTTPRDGVEIEKFEIENKKEVIEKFKEKIKNKMMVNCKIVYI
ncbi:hypothetical protein EIN_220190 [Entamoeba invadens IP1]|uniref:Leucine rich repeat containing protein BspA family protein n=1 Tax=Entamoeba invadens IP1 TaxID=370355 RepID=L7FLU4_ENTIV|nr:hypothetical protein EIN_220190 [Entamoeba invadens IP1]ELP89547.1 hypothetical protein EIN_220190 [Entamoeba invadens IP1]|eukprot:XP_004256318.1 hypothetical protein EIN_220190 [Entamoeba invadens IP1]